MLAINKKDRDLIVNCLTGITCKAMDGANLMQIVGLLSQLPAISEAPAPQAPLPPGGQDTPAPDAATAA